jgi:uncharacterized protein YdaU (DUF1376 family)
MAEFPALPLWTDAYLGDTTHLTTIEHGAYLLLLMAMWRANGSLPDDDRMLARYTKLTAGQWARIAPTVRPFFRSENGRISQGRLTDELKHVRQHSTKQSNAAKARWLKSNDTNDATAMPNECHGNAPTPTPTPTPTEDMGKPISPADKPPAKMRLPDDWALSDEGWAYARSQAIPDKVIEDEARGFHAYWTDRRDRDAKKSARGWEQCWANRCRAIAGRYAGGSMAVKANTGGRGQGRSIASIVAERRLGGAHD